MIVCAYDNRKEAEPGIRLLIASLHRHSPNVRLVLGYPAADQEFYDWVRKFPNVSLENDLVPDNLGWNVKPQLLQRMLERGHNEIIWIDTDIVITRDIEPLFAAVPSSTLVLTEEALWGRDTRGYVSGQPHFDVDTNAQRARAWGFAVARSVPFCINTGVVRVTACHAKLLAEWNALMERPEYLEAETQPFEMRPHHLFSDQEVLTALLCRVDFADVDVKFFRRGEDILQLFGPKAFTTRERLQVLHRGLPTFVHAQGNKPWKSSGGGFSATYLSISPYTHIASQYQSDLSGDVTWVKARNPMSRLLRALGFGHPALSGMPIAMVVDVASLIRQRLKRMIRRLSP
jgi:hypothetical protein